MGETHRKVPKEFCDKCTEPGTKELGEYLLCRKCYKKIKKANRRERSEDRLCTDRLSEESEGYVGGSGEDCT